MKEALLIFLRDMLEGGVAGAVAVLVVTDLATIDGKVLIGVLAAGFIKGCIAASMRYLAKRQPAT